MEAKMIYRYMISVMIQTSNGVSFGRTDLTRSQPITSHEDILEIEKKLPQAFPQQGVIMVSAFSLYADAA